MTPSPGRHSNPSWSHGSKPSAYALILLREAGYPCVFYGDLYGLPNDGIPAVRELPLLMELRRRFALADSATTSTIAMSSAGRARETSTSSRA